MSQINQYRFIDLVKTVTGDIGGAVAPNAVGNIDLTGGVGLTVTGTPGTNSLEITMLPDVTWSREAGDTIEAVAEHGYINTNVGLTTFTLPAAAALGTSITIVGESAAGWVIAQRAGQNIQYGAVSTTAGVGGSVASSNRYDTIRIICRIADTAWSVTATVGVLNVI